MSKRQNKEIPPQTYKNLVEVMSKANNAFGKVLKENKRLDIPTPFSLEDRIYYLMPDGRIVLKRCRSRRKK